MLAYIITATKPNSIKRDVLYLGFPSNKINFIRDATESRVFTSLKIAEKVLEEAKKYPGLEDRDVVIQQL